MKALGYRTRELTAHHLEFALAICALGVVVGWGLGVVGTKSILLVYARYFTEESECASRRSSTTSSGSPPTWT